MATLKRGDKGEDVKRLQQDLIILGYGEPMKGYGADGSFGPATEAAVRLFQKEYKLKVDGIAGSETQGKIIDLLKGAGKNIISTESIDYKRKFEDVEAKLEKIKEIVK